MFICGLKVAKGHIWTKKAISDFQKHMAKACVEMTNCHFMSTSKSLAIAKEFARKNCYIHKFICKKGLEYTI